MPNFKEFIKGFEEKPEQPKPQEVKAEQPQPKEQPKPVEQPQQGRMVYYQGKEMPFEEAKARSMESYSIPKGYKPSEKEKKYMEKAAEYEVEEDDAFARWDHETDPDKKAELRKNMDNLGKEANAFLRELDKEPIDQPKEEPLFDEYKLSTKKGIEEAKNFLDAKGVKDPYALNNEQFNALADEAAKKYGISRMLAGEFLVAPYDEEISKPQAQPKQGSFEQAFGGTSEVEDEKETQPDGYYKDDNGEIYMMKGGKDYYPVGEEERTDFFRAFNNQNKEKAKEMANDPETARSFERIYADLDKGFEETYKRKPTQEEKDAIRDIARLQTALVAMARKK